MRFRLPFGIAILAVLCLLMATNGQAQNRNFGAQTFTMDDGAGHFFTMQAPAGLGGNVIYQFPIPPAGNPPAGFVNIGTAGQTLFWNALPGHNAWEASSVIQNNTNGNGTNVTITAPLIGAGASFTTLGASGLSTLAGINSTGSATIATAASTSNSFGNGAGAINSIGTGGGALSFNYIGNNSANNQFGMGSGTNQFGALAGTNTFGNNATSINHFGQQAVLNDFGGSATFNQYGLSATNNNYGSFATGTDNFGTTVGTNNYNGVSNFLGAAVHGANNVSGSNFTITGGAITSTSISGNTGSFTTLAASTSETLSNLNTPGVVHNSNTGVLSTSLVSLTADVSGVLPIPNGGTGSASQNFVDLTTAQSVAGNKTFTGTTTLGALTQAGTTLINTTGAATTSIGTGGTGQVNIGNSTGATFITGGLYSGPTFTNITDGAGNGETPGSMAWAKSAGNGYAAAIANTQGAPINYGLLARTTSTASTNIIFDANSGGTDRFTVFGDGSISAPGAFTGGAGSFTTLNSSGNSNIGSNASTSNGFGNGANSSNNFGMGGGSGGGNTSNQFGSIANTVNSFGNGALNNNVGVGATGNFFGGAFIGNPQTDNIGGASGAAANIVTIFMAEADNSATTHTTIGLTTAATATTTLVIGGGSGNSSLTVNAPSQFNNTVGFNANAVTGSNFGITGGTITGTSISGNTGSFTTLGASTSETFSNLNAAGVVHNTAGGVLSTSQIATADIAAGAVDLTSKVSGILPVANGGTGSNAQNFVDLTTAQSVGGAKTFTAATTANTFASSGATITGGSVNGTTVGATTPSTGVFTTLAATTGAGGFVLGTGVNATTLSSTASAARAISFPNAAGTLALTSDINAAVSGTTNNIAKFTGANTVGNSALTDNGSTLGYNFFTLTAGQISTFGASFTNTSTNGRIVAITNNDASGGGGTSRGLDILMPNSPVATGTAAGIKFAIAGPGAGTSYDMMGTASSWLLSNAGLGTFSGLNPKTDATFDLGTSALRWNNLYAASTINLGAAANPWAINSTGAALNISSALDQVVFKINTDAIGSGEFDVLLNNSASTSLQVTGAGVSLGVGGSPIIKEFKPGGIAVAPTVPANGLYQIIISGGGFANLNLNDAVTVEFDNAAPAVAGMIWSAAVTASNGGGGTVTINVFNPTVAAYTFPSTTPFYTIIHQ